MEIKWHPWRYSSLLGCHVSVSASNGREKKGRSSRFVLLAPSPLFSLSGFYLANGGLHADWYWASLKPEQQCSTVGSCVSACVCVCLCKLVLILQSSVIIPQQGLPMPSGYVFFFFHLLRFLSIFSFSMTHTHKQESRSDLEKEKEAWLLGSCVAERYLRSDWTNSSSSPWASVSLRFAE